LKAILLSAGYGTRLKPITNNIPKCLVKINNVPLLEHWLNLMTDQGINNVLINTHYLSYKVEKFIELYRLHNPDLKIILKYEQKLLGTAGTVWRNQNFIGIDDCFVINSDNYSNIKLINIFKFHKKYNQFATLGYLHRGNGSGGGHIQLGNNFIIKRFEEKPPIPFSKFIYSGIQVINHKIFQFLPFNDIILSQNSKLDFGYDVFPNLIGHMIGYKLNCDLIDIGDIKSYYLANNLYKI